MQKARILLKTLFFLGRDNKSTILKKIVSLQNHIRINKNIRFNKISPCEQVRTSNPF